MRAVPRRLTFATALAVIASAGVMMMSCESTNGGSGRVLGNEYGSPPINGREASAYDKAVLRCYKTGGSRVVKIEGNLRCF